VVNSTIGMCFPFSCCDTTLCDISQGLSSVAVKGISDVVWMWCSSYPGGEHSAKCPSSVNGKTTLSVQVSTPCAQMSYSLLIWVTAVGVAVAVVCACAVYAYRVRAMRERVQLQGGYAVIVDNNDGQAARDRIAKLRRTAFGFKGKGTAPEGDGAASDDEGLTDPISLDPFHRGEMVVRFPGCHHLFKVDTIARWLETRNTCPVCRTEFDASFLEGSSCADETEIPEEDEKPLAL
jgi:hypothetical protein